MQTMTGDDVIDSCPPAAISTLGDDSNGSLQDLKSLYVDRMKSKALPCNYNFEIEKCIAKIKQIHARRVALQMPEGLLAWGCEISDILSFACPNLVEIIVMADVTYGACCIDDLTADSLECDLIIHYGHSCLVPITNMSVECLYVFVEISFCARHLADVIMANFNHNDAICLLGTIQYSNVLREAARILNENLHFDYNVEIPQCTPLLPGEVLGCTSPTIPSQPCLNCNKQSGDDVQTPLNILWPNRKIIFVADGRFHLESTLIQNPNVPLYRFDPFTKSLSLESYDFYTLHMNRSNAISKAKEASRVCVVLSTLGRQGNLHILNELCGHLRNFGISHYKLLLSEITLDKLEPLDAEAFIQVGCPRLSIDWGVSFGRPLLNPYEAHVAFAQHPYSPIYPMDYYSNKGGKWTNHSANVRAMPKIDPKEAIRQRLAQRAKNASVKYETSQL